MKTPQELAKEFIAREGIEHEEAAGGYCGFLAGYQAAKEQVADTSKVIPQWVSVKKRLPEITHVVRENGDGYSDDVLMLFTDRTMEVIEFERIDGIIETGHGNSLDIVTHWMPLPEPPEEEK